MLQHTKEQIEAKAREIWGHGDHCNDINIDVLVAPDCVILSVYQMYDPVEFNLGITNQLAEFFGTMNIHDDEINIEGCETCDYYSRYGFELTIRPEAA